MLRFLSAFFLWLTMIMVSTCEPFDGLGSNFSSDIKLLDDDSVDIFNKTLSSKSASTLRNEVAGLRTPRTPVFPIPSTSKHSVSQQQQQQQQQPPPPSSILENMDIASYPPNRGFFTPPLPREHYSNPFADKPTLRGSNSENSVSNRRPILPPPPSSSVAKGEKDRIPIKRPDLIVQSDTRKKTINTPSNQKLPETFNYSESSTNPSSSSTTHRINDTFDVVIPVVRNISYTSILRILDNGNKHEYVGSNKSRLEQELKSSKTYKEDGGGVAAATKNNGQSPSATVIKSTSVFSSSLPQSPSVITVFANDNNNNNNNNNYHHLHHHHHNSYTNNISNDSDNDSNSRNGGGGGGGSHNISPNTSSSSSGDGSGNNKSSNFDEEKRNDIATRFAYSNTNSAVDSVVINQEMVIKEQRVTESKSDFIPPIKSIQEATEVTTITDHPEPRARYVLGVAWDVHVYLIAVLFALLACVSALSLIRIRAFKWLLPYGYFLAVHSLLLVIGTVRSVYLFYDAYNISRSFSEPVSRLLLNVVFPFLVCIFSLMFLFILKIVDLKSDDVYYARKSKFFIFIVIVYMLFSVCIDLYADLTPYSSSLILFSHCLFVFLCILLGIAYITFYKYANRSSLRKQNSVYGTAFTDPLRPSLAHAIRVMLATSLLSLLMAAIQLIGMFCVYGPFNKDQSHPWLWWAFQLSVRVIEVSICFLILWAAVQPLRGEDEKETQSHNSASGFPLFPWGAGGTPHGSDHGGNGDDIYSSICSANQAIHNYTLRTNGGSKQVYEDIFQYCNTSSSSSPPGPRPTLAQPSPSPPPPLPLPLPQPQPHSSSVLPLTQEALSQPSQHTMLPVPTSHLMMHHHHHHHRHHHTTERRSFKKHSLNADSVRSACGTLSAYSNRRPLPSPQSQQLAQQQSSPSMLIDEKGIVRFRSIADTEFHSSEEFAAFPRMLHSSHSGNATYSPNT